MSTGGDATPCGTSSAVPADLRAYAHAALQIDEQIHQLALRLGRVLDAYRATNPEFGEPIPRIEDELERYARFCREVDLRVGRIADAFEQAGAAHRSDVPDQPVVVANAVLADAVEAATAPPPKTPAKLKEHHDGGGGLFGGLLHAIEHPIDTLGSAASAAEHATSNALGTVERAAAAGVQDVEEAGAALVHGLEHPSDDLAAAASGLETAAGGVKAFTETRALQGLKALGGQMLHDIEHPVDALEGAQQAANDFVGGFASGVRDMTQAVILLARVIPGTPLWAASMAIDPTGTIKLQDQLVKGVIHMAAHPGESLGTMLDLKDLEAGNFARWAGHLTPDVVVTLLTVGAGSAAAGAGEGIAEGAAEATAADVAATTAADAAEGAASRTTEVASEDETSKASEGAALAADEARAAARAVGGRPLADIGPVPTPDVASVLRGLPAGRTSGVNVVSSQKELERLFDTLTRDGHAIIRPSYPGRVRRLHDGTEVGFREESRSGGPTIDVKLPSNRVMKVHVHPWPPK